MVDPRDAFIVVTTVAAGLWGLGRALVSVGEYKAKIGAAKNGAPPDIERRFQREIATVRESLSRKLERDHEWVSAKLSEFNGLSAGVELNTTNVATLFKLNEEGRKERSRNSERIGICESQIKGIVGRGP